MYLKRIRSAEGTVCRFICRFRPFPFFAQTFLFVVFSQPICSAARPAGQQDNSTSVAELEARVKSGDAAAEFQLAFYFFQTGRPRNYSIILNLLRSSAAQHYAPAQCMLGYLYEDGLGLSHDYRKAAENYLAAAVQDYVPAQQNLANLYYIGRGVHKDLGAAFKWYASAAEHGNPKAESNLGYLYYLGKGTRRDYSLAAKWLRAAAEQGDCRSEHLLGYLYYKGLGVPIDYKETAHWKSLAAEQGDPHAQADLGFLYESGQGVALDYVAAYFWYSRAMAGGVKAAAERRKTLARILTARQLEQAKTLVTSDTAEPRSSLQPKMDASASATLLQSH